MQLILFIIMSVIVFSFPVFGNDNRDEFVRLDSKTQKVEIGKFVSFYEDPTGSLLIDDVSNPGFRNKFANSIKESLNFGFTESAIWLRFEVRNEDQSSNDWLLEIGFPVLDQIEIFAKRNEVWIKKEYGDSIPFASRDFYYRTFIYRLETSSDRTETIYLKVRSTSAMIIPLTIFKTAAFQRESYLMESYYFSIYGILGVMIIYNAFVFFAFRGWSYLLYTLNTLFSLLAFVSLNGHGFQYLWPEMLWWQNRFPFFSGCLVGISGIAFSSQFLGLRKSYPFAFRILGGFQFLLASLCIIGAFSIKNAIQNVNIVNSIAFIFVMIIAVRSFLDGNKSARFFILGWTVLILGGVLIIFRFLGLLPDNFFTRHTLEIGSMIELVLLSLALVDKYKIIQDENIRVHKELFETERQVKETLEIKVNERTAELNKSMQLIKEDLAIAKKIQINTMPTNLKKMQDLEIAVRYDPMNEVGGDFFSVDELDKGIYRIFLADATGHGVQAALVTMAIKGIYDNIKKYELPLSDLLGIFNDEFIQKYASLRALFTCILIEINTKKQLYVYSSAGHPSALILRGKNRILLSRTGTLIGGFDKAKYRIMEGHLEKGDKLFLFTDGIYEEFKNGAEFGEERLHGILAGNPGLSLDDTIQDALIALDDFLDGEEKQDDITILGIRIKNFI